MQVVAAIGSAIPNCASVSNLAHALSLLQQALQLVVASQATTGSVRVSSQPENSPDGSTSQSEPTALEVMDTADSPSTFQVPLPLPQVHEDMDTVASSDGSGHLAGPIVQEPPSPPLRPPPARPLSQPHTPARRPRSSGGSQRSYVVDRRFIQGHHHPGGICSLESLPKKNPHDLVKHAASTASEFVEVIGRMLHTEGGLQATKTKLMQAIGKVVAVDAVYCPDSDARRPAGTGGEALDGWDCSAALKHIQSLFLLPKTLEVLVNCRIGQYLSYLTGDSNHATDVYAVTAHLCSEADRSEVTRYQELLVECGCAPCLADSAWLASDRQADRSRPCKNTEVMTKCLHDTYKPFEPTFLRQCAAMAKTVSWGHPLLFALDVPSGARVCQLLPDLQRNVQMATDEGETLSRLPAYLGQGTVFRVEPAEAIKAVDYVDGDGGFLVVEHVPGLAQYLDSRGLTATLESFSDHGRTLIAFRESCHDAIELSHVYKVTAPPRQSVTLNLGVKSLRLARRLVAECESLLICTSGNLDSFQKRLLVQIVTQQAGKVTSNAEEQLQAGLSYPLEDAPLTLQAYAASARSTSRGVFAIFPVSVACSPDMAPSNLRRRFREGASHITMVEGGARYKVSTPSDWRNDSHMSIQGSELPGAGTGLFGRLQPPTRTWEEGARASRQVTIRESDQVCLYAKRPLTTPASQLATVDYTVEMFANRRLTYDASIYDGSNIGRFANDAGLLPGLRSMVEHSYKVAYPDKCAWDDVEADARAACNAEFALSGTAVFLKATRDIPLGGSQSQEIYVSYGIRKYWFSAILEKIPEWGLDNPMVQALLWCVMSDQSNWDPDMRAVCLRDIQTAYPQIANCHHFPCPWPELLRDAPRPRRARSQHRT